MRYEIIEFGGWRNCIRISNENIELIIASEIGPRVLRFGFIGGQNFFYLSQEDTGKTGGMEWRIYGGHRLWLAPEAIPFSYYPDNEPVPFFIKDNHILLDQPMENTSGLVKQIEISLSPDKNEVTVLHRIINRSTESIELSPWALSAMAPSGRAIIPQEPYGVGNDFLLPARSLALWHYTNMNDPRWVWGEKYIQAKQDPELIAEQKIGVLNKEGWIAYALGPELLIKKFAFDPTAVYPDFGSNNEVYINSALLEIETLGPLTLLSPGTCIEHKEFWSLFRLEIDASEASIDQQVLPLVTDFTMPAERSIKENRNCPL